MAQPAWVCAGGPPWNCGVCTYENSSADAKCCMCETVRAPPLSAPSSVSRQAAQDLLGAQFGRMASSELDRLDLGGTPPHFPPSIPELQTEKSSEGDPFGLTASPSHGWGRNASPSVQSSVSRTPQPSEMPVPPAPPPSSAWGGTVPGGSAIGFVVMAESVRPLIAPGVTPSAARQHAAEVKAARPTAEAPPTSPRGQLGASTEAAGGQPGEEGGGRTASLSAIGLSLLNRSISSESSISVSSHNPIQKATAAAAPATPTGGLPPGSSGVATFAYEAQESWQVSLAVGEQVEVIRDEGDGWVTIKKVLSPSSREVEQGLVPRTYVTLAAETFPELLGVETTASPSTSRSGARSRRMSTGTFDGEEEDDDDDEEYFFDSLSVPSSLSRSDSGSSVASSVGPMSALTPKQRWHKALRKIKVIRAMGGSFHGAFHLPADVEQKRLVARAELLQTETEYFKRLCDLVDCFMDPLVGFVDSEVQKAQLESRGWGSGSFDSVGGSADLGSGGSGGSASWRGPIGPQHAAAVRAVFGTIKMIREFTKHLLEDLKYVLVDPYRKIGPVFVKHAPYLRIYLSYYETFGTSRQALERLRALPWCHAFLSACERQPFCEGRGLRDYLIEPVQRVPRYEMLLKEVIKYTPPGHPNNPALLEALKSVKAVADGMNFDLGAIDSRMKVAALSVAWAGVDFTAPHRLFLKEGILVKTDRHGTKKRYCFLLFNDLVAFGNRIDESKLFSMIRRSGTGSMRESESGMTGSSSGGAAAEIEDGKERYKLRFKAPLLHCLVIDDLMVYSKDGALKLRDDTPHAAAALAIAARGAGGGGDYTERLHRGLEIANGEDAMKPGSGSEPEKAWALLQSCGADMDRVLESQIDPASFMIQAGEKTLYLTAASKEQRVEWVTALAKAMLDALAEDKVHHRSGHRLSSVAGRDSDSRAQKAASEQVVANKSRFAGFVDGLVGSSKKQSQSRKSFSLSGSSSTNSFSSAPGV